ncbi:MAG: nucleoside triphosphate pyrophosphohydrolase [Stellaceae bacterium]
MTMDPTVELTRLLTIMVRLRDPERGCPWDRVQDFRTIAPYTIEEAYEVAEAAETGDPAHLKDELGDLLFQTVFHARMAEEAGLFDFTDVAAAIVDKMIRRHPHVFADVAIADAAAQTVAWEETKAKERAAGGALSVLDGVGVALPALTRAEKLQKRAARVGFDWSETAPVFAKIDEELDELRREVEAGADATRIEDELGDVLFSVVNLARHLKVDPEQSLRAAARKFERRFRAVELVAAPFEDKSLDELEAAWQRVKTTEKT